MAAGGHFIKSLGTLPSPYGSYYLSKKKNSRKSDKIYLRYKEKTLKSKMAAGGHFVRALQTVPSPYGSYYLSKKKKFHENRIKFT